MSAIQPFILRAQRKRLVDIVTRVCGLLGVEVVAPCEVRTRQGRSVNYPLYIPRFSGRNGILADVQDVRDTMSEIDRVREQGGFVGENFVGSSYINVDELAKDELANVEEMLTEWGYYGEPGMAPKFLTGKASDYSLRLK